MFAFLSYFSDQRMRISRTFSAHILTNSLLQEKSAITDHKSKPDQRNERRSVNVLTWWFSSFRSVRPQQIYQGGALTTTNSGLIPEEEVTVVEKFLCWRRANGPRAVFFGDFNEITVIYIYVISTVAIYIYIYIGKWPSVGTRNQFYFYK